MPATIEPHHGSGGDQSGAVGAIATIDAIRAEFLALERRHNGTPVAYFDGPGGTQVPRCVVESIADYLNCHNANAHWNYPSSAETDAMIAAARTALADFLGADDDEIVFGANATTLAFHASRALAPRFHPGDEIVVTELDHHGNIGPWQRLARECGCTLRMVRMDLATSALDWDDFAAKVNDRTRLVAVGAACNAVGTITDVRRAVDLAHAAGAYALVDAVHYAPHRLVDVRAWDCDFLVCSPYKFYGPHLGVLFGRRNLLGPLSFPRSSRRRTTRQLAPRRARSTTRASPAPRRRSTSSPRWRPAARRGAGRWSTPMPPSTNAAATSLPDCGADSQESMA
jgi:cysteine desulfurase family protein (TIGR01976 family)